MSFVLVKISIYPKKVKITEAFENGDRYDPHDFISDTYSKLPKVFYHSDI
jgi:hypothetical protein